MRCGGVGGGTYRDGMTVREHMALRLAAATYRYPAQREADALELVGWTPTRFWAAVGRAIDDPEAVREMPADVLRLRRLRERRRAARRGRIAEQMAD